MHDKKTKRSRRRSEELFSSSDHARRETVDRDAQPRTSDEIRMILSHSGSWTLVITEGRSLHNDGARAARNQH